MMADGDLNLDGFIRALVREAVSETVAQLRRDGAGVAVKPRLLTVEQAATYMGRSLEAMQHLVGDGKIRTVRMDRRVFLDVQDLDRLIEGSKA
jgi:excisionase family DNA binding protein